MKLQLLILSLLVVFVTGCSDGEEGLKEQTVIQTKEEINAQNQNLEVWAAKLTGDLDKRRAFISAVEGEFEGEFLVKESTYMIRLLITPTIPDYDVDRTRTLAELEYELQNLNLNIQIMQWNPNTQLSAVGCILENIKPDLKKGILNLISENCSNTYQLLLSEDVNDIDMYVASQNIASLIKEGRINYIQNFNGKLRSSTNAATYNFSLDRI
jgi:hypothetical protein